ncbi:hypothetical protein M409DRAFT_50863 [Zasmidium cellare ATCC 36951]|uniref:Uncharacterized protein n=1 Tax=Zasmidium cellare ATCC 36951 TaxID=1080233 RepID=A0A6A6CWE3_ZASCE|nr:uncharacterized protein M409DRAFT_50863 [Zasmidium cellare ATCC 36951]KAF2171421.1 hypothetical protein M409DRAFT_50863 [Zasmidium cellare ATCC 36951]
MSLTKDEFFQTWLAAKESQEPHIIETARTRYQHTEAPNYTTVPESNDPDAKAFEAHFENFLQNPDVASQQVSTFASGRVWRSRVLDLFVPPQFALWFRVGVNGKVFNSTRDTNTFSVKSGEKGELYLANQFPAWWQEKSGRVVGDIAIYENGGDGKIEVLVVVWKDGVDVGKLLSNLSNDSELIKAESQRPQAESATNLPPEWYHFWFLGTSTLYSSLSTQDHKKCIHAKPDKSIGILMKDLEPTLVFEKGVKVKWDWKIDALPSRLREDTTFSHDYLSVAFEFENGRDITYTWSWELPVEYGYWCPLPTWEAREYHVVIRSGTTGLGEWLHEERDLFADYEKYIGRKGGVPERITRVWLISNGVFQRLEGEMTAGELGR